MHITLHPLTGTPSAAETGWVDEVLTTLRREGPLRGALISRSLFPATGYAVALWDGAATAGRVAVAGALGVAGASEVGVGPGTAYRIAAQRRGASPGPARYLQLTFFQGPRSAGWLAAKDRADAERIWPAVRDVAEGVAALEGRADDGGCLTLVLATSVDGLEDAMRRIMSTTLLPGEDPALLTGPDSAEIHRLLHADLPSPARAGGTP